MPKFELRIKRTETYIDTVKVHAATREQAIADEIRRLYSTGLTQLAIAKKFDLTQGRISQIVLNKSWVKDGTRTK